MRSCLQGSPAEIDRAFGPARAHLQTASAADPARVPRGRPALAAGLAKILRNVVGARLTGRWRDNPLFPGGRAEPLVAPHVLTRAERAALYPSR